MIDFQAGDFLILVVDDTSRNLQLVIEILDSAGYATTFASNGKQALDRAKKAKPDLILLDLMMPEIGGLEVCRLLKQDADLARIPVIFLTASNEKDNIVRAFESGAVDYVTKPFYSRELLARVRTHLELKKTRDELEKAYQKLEELVATDYLTGVPNRRAVFTFGQNEFQRQARYRREFSVLVIDIDFFKKINDTFGHDAGDKTLIAVARSIRDCLRQVDGFGRGKDEGEEADGFGRWGGEEFVAILPETPLEHAIATAERIRRTLKERTIEVGENRIQITLSVGVTGVAESDTSIEEVIDRADRALLIAKREGRDRVVAG